MTLINAGQCCQIVLFVPVVESRPQKSDTPYSPESIECMHLCWKMDHGRLGANDIITYSSTIVVVRACGYGFLSGNVWPTT